MAPREPPLNDWELRIIRIMLHEYQERDVRDKVMSGIWNDARSLAVIFAGVVIFGIQIATFALALSGK